MDEVTKKLREQLEKLQKLIQELEECPDCGEAPKFLPELYRERSRLALELKEREGKDIREE